MLTSTISATYRRRLTTKFPLIGPWIRRRTAEWLSENRNCPAVAALIVEFVQHRDRQVATILKSAAANLQSPAAIDVLCTRWVKTGESELGALIAAKKYVATGPLKVHVLSALKSGRSIHFVTAEMVPFLAEQLARDDESMKESVQHALKSVSSGPELEALCDEVIRQPRGPLAKICRNTDKYPADPERRCLFLFVTGQLDRYFEEDPDFACLRSIVGRSDAIVQQRVKEGLQTGDSRCVGWFSGGLPLCHRDQSEIEAALDLFEHTEQWELLLTSCLELPLELTWHRYSRIKASGWEPNSLALRKLLNDIAQETDQSEKSAVLNSRPVSRAFEKWLQQGQSYEINSWPTDWLRQQLYSEDPRDGVKAVAALAARNDISIEVRDQVLHHPHWLVQLAGYETGLCPDLRETTGHSGVYWMQAITGDSNDVQLVPGTVTPAEIRRRSCELNDTAIGVRPEIRRVLNLILAYSNTLGTFGNDPEGPDGTNGVFVVGKNDIDL